MSGSKKMPPEFSIPLSSVSVRSIFLLILLLVIFLLWLRISPQMDFEPFWIFLLLAHSLCSMKHLNISRKRGQEGTLLVAEEQ
ncbi:unnamed protein product [Lathyrus sativus]|nr:unnamed protein product [Lathyrus sativus]